MEYSNGRKLRGLMKGKLIGPFYRSAPKNAAQQYFNSTKVVMMKPNTAAATTPAAHTTSSSVSVLTAHKVSFVNMPPPEPQTQTAAAAGNKLVITSDHLHLHHNHNQAGGADHLHEVDAKAATYISAVQQRFKMDHDEELTNIIQL